MIGWEKKGGWSMRQYRIDNSDRKAYPFGLTNVEGGIHVSVEAEAKQDCFFQALSLQVVGGRG